LETCRRNTVRRRVLSLHKTCRKYFGECMCVTQELDDLLSSPVLKESVIANCDCRILLDMRKYANKFDEIQELLGLSDKERNQVLSINRANDPMRRYKEVWIGLGGVHSAVYATETSLEEYLCYTTEETEKLELQRLTEKLGGNIELAIRQLAEQKRNEMHFFMITKPNSYLLICLKIMFISKKELAERDERLRRAQEEIESLKQTIRELQSEVADDRICGC
jgi:hypothetical protein